MLCLGLDINSATSSSALNDPRSHPYIMKFTIVLTVYKLGAGSSWPPAYDLIWNWVEVTMGAWYSFLADLIGAPYLCIPTEGGKYCVDSDTGTGVLMAESTTVSQSC